MAMGKCRIEIKWKIPSSTLHFPPIKNSFSSKISQVQHKNKNSQNFLWKNFQKLISNKRKVKNKYFKTVLTIHSYFSLYSFLLQLYEQPYKNYNISFFFCSPGNFMSFNFKGMTCGVFLIIFEFS